RAQPPRCACPRAARPQAGAGIPDARPGAGTRADRIAGGGERRAALGSRAGAAVPAAGRGVHRGSGPAGLITGRGDGVDNRTRGHRIARPRARRRSASMTERATILEVDVSVTTDVVVAASGITRRYGEGD